MVTVILRKYDNILNLQQMRYRYERAKYLANLKCDVDPLAETERITRVCDTDPFNPLPNHLK